MSHDYTETRALAARLRIDGSARTGNEAADALEAQAAELERVRAERDAAVAALRELMDYIDGDCICPCCTQTQACSEDCTFATDDPPNAERMAMARAVLAAAQERKP